MKEKYMKKFMLEMEINNYLNDIKEYSNSALLYLTNPSDKLDKEEIIMYLSCVEEYTDYVDELIGKIEEEYENDIKELKDERL